MAQRHCFPYQFSCHLLSMICCCDPCSHLCHRVSRDCSYQLEMWQMTSVSVLFPLVGMITCCYWLLPIWALFLDLSLSHAICTTPHDQAITKTLLYHTRFTCQEKVLGACRHNRTTCSICQLGDQYTCFNSQCSPIEK